MKNDKINKIQKLFIIYFSVFPILNMYFFHSKITTLLEIIIALILMALVLVYEKKSRKKLFIPILYIILVLTYLLINYIRSFSFSSYVPDNFNYSLFNESLTIIKLITPVIMIYFLHYLNLTLKQYLMVINIWAILITSNIIITNILKISLCSYSLDTITYNIFEWQTGISYLKTASKGFFTYANQQSAMIVVILPFIFYQFTNKCKYILLIFLLLISGLMLGTRVSSIGSIIVVITLILMFLVISLIKRQKVKKHLCLLVIPLIISAMLIPISPYNNRNNEFTVNNENKMNKKAEETENNINENYKIEYFNKKVNNYYLPKVFYEKYYPIKYDVDFWYEFIKNTPTREINYRLIEKSIIKRVKEINNDKLDTIFGISNTRIQNIFNIEQDFILHYYAFGIIGMIILLIEYFISVPYILFKFIKKHTFINLIIMSSVCLFIFISILSGNIINSLNVIIPFSLIISMIYNKNIDKIDNNLL